MRASTLCQPSSSGRCLPSIPTRAPVQHPRRPTCSDLRNAVACKANAGDEGGPDKPDIDALAAMLSAQAARLRASMEAGADGNRGGKASSSTGSAQYDKMEARLFEEVGHGGFDSVDFELVQQLGSIRVLQAFNDSTAAANTAVVVYAARFHPRLNYTRPVPTLLKEYLPVARPVACNELLLLKHLFGASFLPENKYEAALLSPPSAAAPSPPVVPLLGYFLSAPSEQAAHLSTDESLDSIWLVYRWEGLRPISMLMQEGPPQPMYGLLKSRESAEEEAWRGRCEVLRAATSGLLAAIDFCHSADVVHGSLSSGSVLLGSWEELGKGAGGGGNKGGAPRLEVKLDGFGFGKWFVYGQPNGGGGSRAEERKAEVVAGRVWPAANFGPQSDDAALEAGKREDLQAAALLLAEAYIACLAPGTPRAMRQPGTPEPEALVASGGLDRSALQRLLFDVFHEDINMFREYCLEDPARYSRTVAFLDESDGAGWDLLADLLKGAKSALQLSQHRFLQLSQEVKQTSGGFKMPWS